jgi:uncharacterized protein YdaU (DUF1376 family)
MSEKTSFPYVPWYHGDFLRSTAGWSLLERGAYWMLLCAQWEIGPLPDDLERLATIVGLDLDAMRRVWPNLSRKFTAIDGGLVNERMEEHRANIIRHRTSLSEAGKKGMEKRWAGKRRPKQANG